MDSVKVLMTLRFSEELVKQVREVSSRLVVVQKSVKENWDGMDTGEFFDGDEEILYGFMPPRDLSIAPKLKWLQLHSAGINHLINSQHPILQTNVKITTSSGIHAVPIGEFSIALMIALARRVPRMVRMQNSGVWTTERWKTFLGTELHRKTLGIIGYGSIGRHVANIAKRGFGMFIMAMTRSGERRDRGYTEPGVGDPDGALPDVWFTPAQLPDMLSQADFLLVAAPLTSETHYMIDERELRMMKPTSFIINIARGSIINEAALVRALKENWIAGAGLDVFEKEPLPTTSELWNLENAIIAPHVSSATPHYDERATELFCENLRRYINGEELLNLVKREIGY